MPKEDQNRLVARIRLLLALFAIGLALSGLTAFPLIHEVAFLAAHLGPDTSLGRALPDLANWIAKVDLAFICGPIRGIPLYWRLIDCSFGVIGVAPLLLARRAIRKLESVTESGNAI